MRNRSYKKVQKKFHKMVGRFIEVNGRPVKVKLPEVSADCPNCINDFLSGMNESSNRYDVNFIRPVNLFPGTSEERMVYPQPFNITTLPLGIVFNPEDPNPRILNTTICPVCRGRGKLVIEPTVCINANWNWGSGVGDGQIVDYSAGRFPSNIGILKTNKCNYSICRDAKGFIIDGVECEAITPPIKKGVGTDAFLELRLQKVDSSDATSRVQDKDNRVNVRPIDTKSDQASSESPHTPPNTFSHEDW